MKPLRQAILTLFFFSVVLISTTAQSRFNAHLRFDYIINGINESTSVKEYELYLNKNEITSKPSFSIGVQYDYLLDKKRKIAIHLGTLFEFRNYTRLLNFHYPRSGWSNGHKKDLQSRYLSIPIGFSYQLGRLKLTTSFVNTINLKTKLQSYYCGYQVDEPCDYWLQYSISNDFTKKKDDLLALFNEEIFADSWYHQQLTFGIQYQITEMISFGLEYRDFIKQNYLYYNRLNWESYLEEQVEQQTNSLHFALFFKL